MERKVEKKRRKRERGRRKERVEECRVNLLMYVQIDARRVCTPSADLLNAECQSRLDRIVDGGKQT